MKEPSPLPSRRCPYCLANMAAKTEAQWLNRQRNIRAAGELVGIGHCPSCGGTAWATTREMIEQAPRDPWLQTRRVASWIVAMMIAGFFAGVLVGLSP